VQALLAPLVSSGGNDQTLVLDTFTNRVAQRLGRSTIRRGLASADIDDVGTQTNHFFYCASDIFL
jgi:hypothetical protein